MKNFFKLSERKTNVRTEIVAGVTTFMAMAYILMVNPGMFAQLDDVTYGASYIATAISAVVGTLLIGLLANLPLAQAPGMGLNAFFVFTVCMSMDYSWQFALTAVLIEGILFIIMTITNIREAIVNAIPQNLRYAIGAGIGLFIAFIGLQNAGIIVNNDATLVGLGEITKGSALLAIIGLVITGVLYAKNVRGAMLIGILATTLIGIPMGITEFKGVVAMPDSIAPIFWQFEWDKILSLDMLVVVFTFLFIDMFDTMGTLIGVCTKADMVDKKTGRIPRLKDAFMADAISTTFGAMIGTSTTTTYVESASGVAQGGRSGLTAFVIACCFVVTLFFSPLFLSIPAAATAPVLILVGLLMIEPITKIDLADFSESIPAFACIIMMPLAYSISDGILTGMILYVIINMVSGNFKKITPTMYVLAVLFILKYIFF